MKLFFILFISFHIELTNLIVAQPTFQHLYNYSQKQYGFKISEVDTNQFLFLNYISDCALCPHIIDLIKVNNLGDTLFTKQYNFGNQTYADYYIQSGNSFVIPIISNPTNNTITTIIKVDSILDVIWQTVFSLPGWNLSGTIVLQSYDSNFIVCGTAQHDTSVFNNLFFLKLDSNGNILWNKFVNFENTIYINSIIELDSGALVFTGSKIISQGKSNILIYKTNSIGDSLFTKTYSFNSFSQALNINKWRNKFILNGYTSDSTILNSDGFVLFVDQNLDSTSSYIFDIGLNESIYSSTCDSSELVLAGSAYNSNQTIGDVFILRFDTNNLFVSHKILNGLGIEYYNTSIAKTFDGGFIIGTTSYNSNGYPSALLIKTDNNGDLVYIPKINSAPPEIIYPNPSNGIFYLQDKYPISNGIIYSIQGEEIYKFSGNQFDISEFKDGLYIFEIIYNSGIIKKGKILKMN